MQNDLYVKFLMFNIQILNVKMIQMSNVKLFDVSYSNDKCQNDLNVKLFDVGHSNVYCDNVEHQTV